MMKQGGMTPSGTSIKEANTSFTKMAAIQKVIGSK
jgi:hypothetical protein